MAIDDPPADYLRHTRIGFVPNKRRHIIRVCDYVALKTRPFILKYSDSNSSVASAQLRQRQLRCGDRCVAGESRAARRLGSGLGSRGGRPSCCDGQSYSQENTVAHIQ